MHPAKYISVALVAIKYKNQLNWKWKQYDKKLFKTHINIVYKMRQGDGTKRVFFSTTVGQPTNVGRSNDGAQVEGGDNPWQLFMTQRIDG